MARDILIVLHSELSTAGRIGHMLEEQGPSPGYSPALPW